MFVRFATRVSTFLVVIACFPQIHMIYAQRTTTPTTTEIPFDRDANECINDTSLDTLTVRLHLIRHGETEANVANIVLGQGDSPLTQNGLDMAARASSSPHINGQTPKYWRMYCSDLYRAHRTAKIVLGLEDVESNKLDSSLELVVESRLREIAKGAREGYLKSLSQEEALELRARDANGESIQLPLLETSDDAWERVKDWIDSLLQDALDDFSSKETAVREADAHNVYRVFALSHSALIRTMIHKMVDDELPNNYAKTREGSLSIPNLSCTTIDIRPLRAPHGVKNTLWRASLVRLTDVSHLNGAASSSVSGPPYL